MKDIKEYLHLYLGCDLYAPAQNPGEKYGIYSLTPLKIDSYLQGGDWSKYDFKLILRPLSDMTEEEASYLKELNNHSHTIPCPHFNNIHQTKHGEQLRYLLSKHFDLFGLIESGLAIDKTTLTSSPSH